MNTMPIRQQEEKVKNIQFGVLVNYPIEGASLIIVKDGKTMRTSPVTKFMSFYADRLWVVETYDSIYALTKEE